MKTPASFYFRLLPPVRAMGKRWHELYVNRLRISFRWTLISFCKQKEECGGAFVDRQSSEEVADRSIIRVIMKPGCWLAL